MGYSPLSEWSADSLGRCCLDQGCSLRFYTVAWASDGSSPAGNDLARRSESLSGAGEVESEGLEGPSGAGEHESEGLERPSEVGEVESEGLDRASGTGEVPSEFLQGVFCLWESYHPPLIPVLEVPRNFQGPRTVVPEQRKWNPRGRMVVPEQRKWNPRVGRQFRNSGSRIRGPDGSSGAAEVKSEARTVVPEQRN